MSCQNGLVAHLNATDFFRLDEQDFDALHHSLLVESEWGDQEVLST